MYENNNLYYHQTFQYWYSWYCGNLKQQKMVKINIIEISSTVTMSVHTSCLDLFSFFIIFLSISITCILIVVYLQTFWRFYCSYYSCSTFEINFLRKIFFSSWNINNFKVLHKLSFWTKFYENSCPHRI